jgi:Tol biopolymer transport system component
MAIPVGTRLGPYEILSAIGAGGMGEVYRAHDTRLNRDVALKVLPEAFARDAQRMARFEREAKLLASLNHPHIAAIYGLEESGPIRALVMELVEGPTLAERILNGAIPLDEALPIARQVADAVEYAHDKNVIHRDLKPANIKVTAEGTVKVLDFGLAKALSDEPTQEDMSNSPTLSMAATRQGVILGTAAYMAPEQARGKTADRRADIWAFGVVLYEMLTGKRAFEGEDVSMLLAAVMKSEPDWERLPADLPPAVRVVLRRCLQKDPKQRLQAIGDVRLAMEGAFETVRSEAAPAATQPAGWWRAVVVGLATLVAGSVIAGLTVWTLMRPAPQRPARWPLTPSAGESMTSQTGTDIAISPDGTRIVYIADRNGTRQLYLRRTDQLGTAAIPGTEDAIAPFFSPDGEWVAFGAYPEGKLKKVSLLGGPPVTICDVPDLRNASWGDGGTIVFASGLTEGGLFRVSAAGGKPELLAAPDAERGEQWYRWPEFLPGEHAVLFTVYTTGAIEKAQIAVLSLDTHEQKILVDGGSDPSYARTGHLVYAQVGTLMAVPFDLASLEVSGTPVPLQEGVLTKGGGAADFALSRSSLVYVPGGAETGGLFDGTLVWVDRRGRAVDAIVDEPLQRPRNLRLSPDARRLALITGSIANGALWVYDLQGRPPAPLTLEGNNSNPVWTPDGARVAFQSERNARTLFWMPADGSTLNAEELFTSPNSKYPAGWSSDGRELLYSEVRPGTRGDILALPLEGERKPRDVVATGYFEWLAALSPDGRRLAYVSNVTGRDEIWVRAYPGPGAPDRVSSNGGTEPVWSRNGRELFYLQDNKMMAVAVQSGAETRFGPAVELFDEPYGHGGPPTYDVAPDGRFVMIQPGAGNQQTQAETSIVVVENWLEELKRLAPTGNN